MCGAFFWSSKMTELDSETSLTLRDELEAGLTPETLDAPPSTTAEAVPEGAPPIPPELPPLEAPAMWGKQYKEVFSQIAQTPEQRAYAEAWLNQWKETQGYITKRDQEYADYRKRFDPINERVSQYEQYWGMQGLSLEQGVHQLLSYAEALARDPAGMIPQLAQLYGVDLQQLVAEQPYVDPEVAALRQQLQEIQQQQHQWSQHQQQQLHDRLIEEVLAFKTAADEQGNPKHPHLDRVFDRMIGLARGGLANSIQDAYEMAVNLDKELQAELAQQRAQAEAAARATDAKKAMDASRTVKSKSVAEGAPPERSLRDELAAQLEAAGLS
jgi:hypothetical protein